MDLIRSQRGALKRYSCLVKRVKVVFHENQIHNLNVACTAYRTNVSSRVVMMMMKESENWSEIEMKSHKYRIKVYCLSVCIQCDVIENVKEDSLKDRALLTKHCEFFDRKVRKKGLEFQTFFI